MGLLWKSKIRSLEIPSGSLILNSAFETLKRFQSLRQSFALAGFVHFVHIHPTEFRLLDFTSGSSRVTSFQKCKNALFPFRSAFTLAHYVRFHLTSVLRKIRYSTVTDFARFLGWSTSFPKYSAIWYAKSCNITIFKAGETISEISGIKTKSLKIAWCFSSI